LLEKGSLDPVTQEEINPSVMISNSHIKKVIDKFLIDNPDYKPPERPAEKVQSSEVCVEITAVSNEAYKLPDAKLLSHLICPISGLKLGEPTEKMSKGKTINVNLVKKRFAKLGFYLPEQHITKLGFRAIYYLQNCPIKKLSEIHHRNVKLTAEPQMLEAHIDPDFVP
jgi:hypothetical protein